MIPWNKGRKTTKEERHKLSVSHLGQEPWNKGLTKDKMLALGKKVGGWREDMPRSQETNEKISKANKGNVAWNKGLTRNMPKGRKLSGGRPKGGIPWNRGKTGIYSDEARRNMAWNRGQTTPPEIIKKRVAKLIGHPTSQETREKIGRANKIHMLKKWQDPEYRQNAIAKWVKGNLRKPTKPELRLQHILDTHVPGQWKYTGDGTHIIGGFPVDFTNCDGAKAVIELFGDYWHTRGKQKWHQGELGRIMAFNSLGFRCLVIWEHELKDEHSLVTKVRRFMKVGR